MLEKLPSWVKRASSLRLRVSRDKMARCWLSSALIWACQSAGAALPLLALCVLVIVAAVRKAEGLTEGDDVTVIVSL